MKFLNGWKTLLGVVGIAVTVAVQAGGDVGKIGQVVGETAQHVDSAVLGVFGALAALGIIHKVEKKGGR